VRVPPPCFGLGSALQIELDVLLTLQKRTTSSPLSSEIKFMKITTLLLTAVTSTSAFAAECYLGEVRSFAFYQSKIELEGFVRADGQLLQIRENEALFSLLGDRYGGDSRTTFAVPQLNSPNEKLVHYICTEGIYPSRR
jgi:hypothetical protein